MDNNPKWYFSKRILSNILVVFAGILFFLLLSNFGAVWAGLRWFAGICSPFLIALGLAYMLNMPMKFFERRLFARFRFRRVFSLLVTYILLLAVLALIVGLVLPQVVQSVVTLVGNISSYIENLEDLAAWMSETFQIERENLDFIVVSYTDIVRKLLEWGRGMLPNLLGFTVRFGSGLISVLTALIASVYILASKEKLLRQSKKIVYAMMPLPRAQGVGRIFSLCNGVFSGFISGKIIDSAIIGAICFVFMWLTRMPYALLISVIVGITNIIPFFGPFIGAIPSAMILLMADPWRALWFIIFIIVLQQFDGNFLGPRILGDSTGLPALWVLVAIIVGGGLFGFLGMLLGVPTAAVLYTLFSTFINTRLQKKNIDNIDDYPKEEAELPQEEE